MRKIRKGDTVIALTGKDKGKQGKVLQLLVAKNRACVEGINLVKKHVKPNRQNETGGILEIEAPLHISNVKVLEKKKEAKKEAKKEVKEAEVKEVKAKKTSKKKEESK